MKWKKMGNIFCPCNEFGWMQSYASNPTVEVLDGNDIMIYFSSRDDLNRSNIGYIIISMDKPEEIKNISSKPVLSLGNIGAFDDSGITVGSVIKVDEETKYLYYLGWFLGKTVPFSNTIGLAIWDKEDKIYKKFSEGPILSRDCFDEYSLSYPFVLKHDSKWEMWYGSTLGWNLDREADMIHVIKYAESNDGIIWEKKNHICIKGIKEYEYAISRPCVIKDKKIYKMWYSYRGNKDYANYRIGYAESFDGINWKRMDSKVGIDLSQKGWDSEMIEYPFVFKHKNDLYMLYNGNRYGKTGFGLAILE